VCGISAIPRDTDKKPDSSFEARGEWSALEHSTRDARREL
jgi:hypothetical protein